MAKSQVSVPVVPGLSSCLTRTGIGTSVSVGDVIAVQVQSVGELRGALKIVVAPGCEGSDGAVVDDAPPLRTGGPPWVAVNGAVADEPSLTREDVTVGVPAGSVAELEGLRRAGVHVPTALPGAGQSKGPRRRVRTEVEVVHTERPLIGNEFTDLSEQLDLEIRVEWARRVDAAAKATHPLRFRFNVGFLWSVRRVIDDSEALRWKLPRVMMWIASGYGERTTRPHQFRISDAGGAPYLVRDDRATAYRVDLETNTAAARRLHHWRVPDGTEEFQRVCAHDAPGF
ncbi:hypothetical protein ACYB2S_10050 [Corynebacterium variabile]|uniref:hypothetical protein n=1 Tax=Corynebacterium variabile TaxID=1727 RepID=UPI003CC07A1E